jgi:hypothetical protein
MTGPRISLIRNASQPAAALVRTRLILRHRLDLCDKREVVLSELDLDLRGLFAGFTEHAERVFDCRLHAINRTSRVQTLSRRTQERRPNGRREPEPRTPNLNLEPRT